MTTYSTRYLLTCSLFALAACDPADPPAESDAESASDTDDIDDTVDPSEGDTVDLPDDDPDSGDSDDSDSGDSGEPPAHEDLFACEAPLACEQLYLHLDYEPYEAFECVIDLVATQGTGSFRVLESYGGVAADESESFVVVRGDGTALVQSRSRYCEDCDTDALAWEIHEPRICSISADDFSWNYSDCEPAPDLSCEEVQAALEAPAEQCDANSCGEGELCVAQALECICNDDGRLEYAAGARACAAQSDECADSEDLASCHGAAHCGEADEAHGYDEDGALLECGGGAVECYGDC